MFCHSYSVKLRGFAHTVRLDRAVRPSLQTVIWQIFPATAGNSVAFFYLPWRTLYENPCRDRRISAVGAALRAASRLLASEDRQIAVLYVSPKPLRSKSGERAQQVFRTNLAAEAQRILHSAEMVLKEEGVMAATRSECGSPSGVIMRLAEDYDLVVIGAKGREVQPGIGLGPVASRIVEHANGYVFVGREPPTDRQARVLAAVDGSAGSEHALDALISLFDLENS
jgi:nucleotide-binding universal stress UspA family protein